MKKKKQSHLDTLNRALHTTKYQFGGVPPMQALTAAVQFGQQQKKLQPPTEPILNPYQWSTAYYNSPGFAAKAGPKYTEMAKARAPYYKPEYGPLDEGSLGMYHGEGRVTYDMDKIKAGGYDPDIVEAHELGHMFRDFNDFDAGNLYKSTKWYNADPTVKQIWNNYEKRKEGYGKLQDRKFLGIKYLPKDFDINNFGAGSRAPIFNRIYDYLKGKADIVETNAEGKNKLDLNHMIRPEENYSAMMGLRYLLYKQGHYDASKGEPLTEEVWKKAMTDPTVRDNWHTKILQYNYEDADIFRLLNEVAANKSTANRDMARYGGKMKRKKYFPGGAAFAAANSSANSSGGGGFDATNFVGSTLPQLMSGLYGIMGALEAPKPSSEPLINPMTARAMFSPYTGSGVKQFGKGGWIRKAAASIKRRGTKGKCTPITKPGCTGRALALAKTFKKIARKRKKHDLGGYIFENGTGSKGVKKPVTESTGYRIPINPSGLMGDMVQPSANPLALLLDPIGEIRDRLAKNFDTRAGYNREIRKDLYNAIVRNKRKYNTNVPLVSANDSEGTKLERDLFLKYLGKKPEFNTYSDSPYKPTKSKDPNAKYIQINNYASNLSDDYDLAFQDLFWKQKEKHVTDAFYDMGLGNYTVDYGSDEKGNYISYYDKWNISPLGGVPGKQGYWPDKSNQEDQSFGVGKPFEVYGRVYYDKKTGKKLPNQVIESGHKTPKIKTYQYGGEIGTKLTHEEERMYQVWKARLPKPLQWEGDYDLRGLWKSNPNAQPTPDLHFPDTYKLPNHKTFSNESIYYQGVTPGEGGYWRGENYIKNPRVGPPMKPSRYKNGGKVGPDPPLKPIYVPSKTDPRYRAYSDSLNLFNSYLQVKDAMKKQGYTMGNPSGSGNRLIKESKARPYKSMFTAKNNPYVKQNKNGTYYVQDFDNEMVNTSLPFQLFNPNIKPVGVREYVDNDWYSYGTMPSYMDLNGILAYAVPYKQDVRKVYEYNNVYPKQEVRVGQDPDAPQQQPKPKSTVKSKPTKIAVGKPSGDTLYVYDKNSPELKRYKDSTLMHKLGEDAYRSAREIMQPYRPPPPGSTYASEWFDMSEEEARRDPRGMSIGGPNTNIFGFKPIERRLMGFNVTKESYKHGNRGGAWGTVDRFKKPTRTVILKSKPPKPKKPKAVLTDVPQQTGYPATPTTLTRQPMNPFQLPEGSPVYGPANGFIGVWDKNKQFYPDYGNVGKRAKVNKADSELLGDREKLGRYFKMRGLQYPGIKYRYGGRTKYQHAGYVGDPPKKLTLQDLLINPYTNTTVAPTDNTYVQRGNIKLSPQEIQANKIKNEIKHHEESVRATTEIGKRKARMALSNKAQEDVPFFKPSLTGMMINPDVFNRQHWADVGAGTGDKLRLFPGSVGGPGEFVDTWANPLHWIGNMAGNLGSAPLRAQQENSVMPYVQAIGEPLIAGALGFDPLGKGLGVGKKVASKVANHPLGYTIPYLNKESLPIWGTAATLAVANRLKDVVTKTPGIGDLYKRAAYNIASENVGHVRGLGKIDFGNIFRKPDFSGVNYKGLFETPGHEGRNLIANYIYGHTEGFTPTELPISMTKDVSGAIAKHGELKKYGLDTYGTAEGSPAYFNNSELQGALNSTTSGRHTFRKKYNIPEDEVITKEIIDRLLDEHGELSFGLDVSESPISVIADDVGGHMGIIGRDAKTGQHIYKTQDTWKFAPKAYNKKWNMDSRFYQGSSQDFIDMIKGLKREGYNYTEPIKNHLQLYTNPKMAGLMEAAGKPFVLIDQRPLTYAGEGNFKYGGITKKKAAEILHDGTVHGHALTPRQRRYMAWKAYGGRRKYQPGGTAGDPPRKLTLAELMVNPYTGNAGNTAYGDIGQFNPRVALTPAAINLNKTKNAIIKEGGKTYKKKVLAERKAAKEDESQLSGNVLKDIYDPNTREKLYKSVQKVPESLRFFPNSVGGIGEAIDNFSLYGLGKALTSPAEAPYLAQQTNSNNPYYQAMLNMGLIALGSRTPRTDFIQGRIGKFAKSEFDLAMKDYVNSIPRYPGLSKTLLPRGSNWESIIPEQVPSTAPMTEQQALDMVNNQWNDMVNKAKGKRNKFNINEVFDVGQYGKQRLMKKTDFYHKSSDLDKLLKEVEAGKVIDDWYASFKFHHDPDMRQFVHRMIGQDAVNNTWGMGINMDAAPLLQRKSGRFTLPREYINVRPEKLPKRDWESPAMRDYRMQLKAALAEMELMPYKGKEAFKTIKPNRYGGYIKKK